MKYFCTTEAIALYLQKYIVYRKRKIFFGNSGKLDDLVPSLLKHAGEKYLFPGYRMYTKSKPRCWKSIKSTTRVPSCTAP